MFFNSIKIKIQRILKHKNTIFKIINIYLEVQHFKIFI